MSICSAGDRSRENRLLQGKSNRNVFGSAVCFRTGIFASENLFQNNNNSEILVLVMVFCLLMKVVIEIPHIFVQTLVYCLIVYSMIGFEWRATKLLWYLFFMYFTLLYFTLYGMMTVALTPEHNVAAIASTTFYALWKLFSGFFIPRTVSSDNVDSCRH